MNTTWNCTHYSHVSIYKTNRDVFGCFVWISTKSFCYRSEMCLHKTSKLLLDTVFKHLTTFRKTVWKLEEKSLPSIKLVTKYNIRAMGTVTRDGRCSSYNRFLIVFFFSILDGLCMFYNKCPSITFVLHPKTSVPSVTCNIIFPWYAFQ